jgi:hypothetical protein
MIIIAVTLTIFTRQSQWALMFGGAAVPTVIGVMIWKPYDRLFRAVVLIQQLEMIHIQTVAAFSGTEILQQRIEICTSAVNALTMLLQDTNGVSPTKRKQLHNSRSSATNVKSSPATSSKKTGNMLAS